MHLGIQIIIDVESKWKKNENKTLNLPSCSQSKESQVCEEKLQRMSESILRAYSSSCSHL